MAKAIGMLAWLTDRPAPLAPAAPNPHQYKSRAVNTEEHRLTPSLSHLHYASSLGVNTTRWFWVSRQK